MSNKIIVTKPASLTVSSPGIHPIDRATYQRKLHHAGAWNFEPLTAEQIEKARRDFVRSCAGADKDAKISESLNEAIQAPMDHQAVLTAVIDMMKIEIKDNKIKVPELPEHSGVFKKPGVDEPIDLKFTYQHMPFITAAMIRDKKSQMADCKLNGIKVKNMTLAEFQAVWAQQIEDQAQSRMERIMLDRLEAAAREERNLLAAADVDTVVAAITRAQINPCAEIVLGEPEPDVLTSASAEKQRIEENLAKLKASQTLNESEKIELEQHLVGLRASLSIREKDNRLANDARHTKYQDFLATQAEEYKNFMAAQSQERSDDLLRRREIDLEIENFRVHMDEPIRPKEAWVDTEAEPVILKSTFEQAQDRMHRHWKSYDAKPNVLAEAYGSKRPCPDCGGSGKYVGLNHTETCPSCKGSKVV